MPSRADLRIYQGDDYAALVTVTNGLPPDEVIAGYTARAQIREDVADNSDAVVVDIGAVVESPYVNLFIPASQTAQICGEYVWDLEITSPGGMTTTILAGGVLVTEEVTR